MTQSIGEKLRLAREARGIALREISEQTRISMRYLEGIETDDYKRLPGGIFNRSFIRAYAKFIGYDEHEAIEDYTRTLRERGEEEEDTSSKPRSEIYVEGAESRRSPLLTLLLAIMILAALSLAVWAGVYFYKRSMGQSQQPPALPLKVALSLRDGNASRPPASSYLLVCKREGGGPVCMRNGHDGNRPRKEIEHDFSV